MVPTKSVAAEVPVILPSVIAPVPEPPKALVLVEPVTVPALMVNPPVKVLVPDKVRLPESTAVKPKVAPEIIPEIVSV